MDYKEKYENALKRAKGAHDSAKSDKESGVTHKITEYTVQLTETIFPELKENKDEEVRKALINFFSKGAEYDSSTNGVKDRNILAWLEKQGGNKLEKYINDKRNKKDFYCEGKEISWNEMSLAVRKHDYPYYFKGDLDCYPFNVEKQGEQIDIANKEYWRGYREGKQEIIDKYAKLEKQGEQKPTEEIKPKFKVGDWIISSEGTLRHIVDVTKRGYETDKGWLTHDDYEKRFHIWTIQDAKDGDVLAAHECIVLFKEIDGLNIKCHCTYHFMNNPSFYVNTLQNKNAFHPATKEERDRLEKAMLNAGYKWNKKECKLEKIKEQNPTEDNCKISDCDTKVDVTEYNNGYECGKQRVLKYPEDYGLCKKSDWSEEDEAFLKVAIAVCNRYSHKDIADWLKSITPQPHWKPSDEQLRPLEYAIDYFKKKKNDTTYLESLYNDLQKL